MNKLLGIISTKPWMESWRANGFESWILGWVGKAAISFPGNKTIVGKLYILALLGVMGVAGVKITFLPKKKMHIII